MDSTMQARFDSALARDEEEGGLIELVKQFKAEGLGQRAAYDLFEEFLLWLQEAERQTEEDRVADVMDYICGFCSLSVKLFPDMPYMTFDEPSEPQPD